MLLPRPLLSTGLVKGLVGSSGPKSFAGWSFPAGGEGCLLPSLGYLLLKLKEVLVLDEERYLGGHDMEHPQAVEASWVPVA